MKTLRILGLTALLLAVSLNFAYGGNPFLSRAVNSASAIEDNLLAGLASDNYGLRTSSSYFLGEYKIQRALLPLMELLHSKSADDNERIQSALSLIKIGDPRGIYMVKQAARFDKSDRVKRMCTIFYNSLNKNLKTANRF